MLCETTPRQCFRFLHLPKELQLDIVCRAIPPRIVFFDVGGGIKPRAASGLMDLLLSCREIHDMVMFHFQQAYNISPRAGLPGPMQASWRLHPRKDTLCITESVFPADTLPTPTEKQAVQLEVNNARLCATIHRCCKTRILVPAERIINWYEFWLPWPPYPADMTSNYDTRFPLDIFPNLKEATLILAVSPREWEIQGLDQFQAHKNPGLALHTTNSKQCMRKDRDVQFDEAGVPFICQRWEMQDHFCYFQYEEIRTEDGGFWAPPYIGVHGYTDGVLSHGGHWAGFRLFTETGVVQFAALDYWDVEEAFEVNALIAPCKSPWNRPATTPTLVVRLWVDPPESFGSEYNWIDVRASHAEDGLIDVPVFDGQDDWTNVPPSLGKGDVTMRGIAMIWALFRDRMQQQSMSYNFNSQDGPGLGNM